MKIEVLTLFPEWVEQVTQHGMPRIAAERGQLQLVARNLRDYSTNKWRKVDDRPYGGGPGMVMEAEPLAHAIRDAKASQAQARVVYLSPQGERFSQGWAERLSQEQGLVLLCGRYEGLDERLIRSEVDFELSLGDFVMSGGELAAMVVVDAIARLLPGVLGHEGSAAADSFSSGLLDHPHYTRPEDWRGERVPEVLLGGDHAKVARWRLKQALGQTWLKRPDLLDGIELDRNLEVLLREFISEQRT
ncbi:tRNA (guanosine(37)-N1)-methyltransferase TrmD [Solimonas sp. K1W22B-7]|uniref:tRNA (guanosine(37)-N1)-methyltransferase TrmD n=1 Tax=Solimonas sp. K1W22B-7 TaxID=2303331 RepID=UPI000E32FF2C|nr:tRNA (guanosine(37)-N1)-methyltransferase TrmD [Solimonas sp. K1W22B-7]AXQ29641.1 tRNA (guanosine(37)-N1)-methyltransferase TrmD [Solimonas sp. K1W22B-7]